MQRRDFIAGLGGAALTACATAPERGIAPHVMPVKVRRDRILKSVVGLRPHREGGFRLETAPLQGKALIHNYGHSGDGVSLSHGSSHIAAEMAHAASARDTAVIGSGVMGLTTARLLSAWGHEVTIYAADFPPHTTSKIAGAQIIIPRYNNRRAPTKEILEQDARVRTITRNDWESMAGRRGYGVKRVTSYRLRGAESGMRAEPKDVFLGRRIRRRHEAIIVDPGIYLEALLSDIRSAGVRLEPRKFNSANDITALPQKTIINCTGLGAGKLFLDKDVVPIRGQLTLLKPQPEIDYSYLAADPVSTLYMFPRETSIVLGGTRQRGKTHLSIDEATVERMLREHGAMAGYAGRRLGEMA